MRAFAIAALVLCVARAAHADETCIGCHAMRSEARLRGPVTARGHDVHALASVGCSDCHGGDPNEPSARAHDLGRGFRGVPDALGVAQVCGRCHDGSREHLADVASAYQHGRHGRAAALGEPTASCTSCHGAHGIERHDAPSSPVARTHVASTCGSCHADDARMAQSGLPTDQLAQWRTSVHGAAFATDPEHAPTCSTCHDPHRNVAGLAAVAACSQCHAAIRAAFDRGPHAGRFSQLGFLDCAECHGSHEVRPADATLLTGLGAACGRCHGPGQEVFDCVRRIEASATRLDAARASLPADDPRRVALLAALHALDVDGLEAALETIPPAPAEPPADAAPAAMASRFGIRAALWALTIVAALAVVLAWRTRRRS
jgi:hypothetical protein